MVALDTAIAKAIDALCQQLRHLTPVPDRQYPYRLQQTLERCGDADLSDWLAAQSLFPKFFWRSRDRHCQIAALGSAIEYRDQQASAWLQANIPQHQGLRYYWLSGFDNLASSDADSLDSHAQQLLFLPQIELSQAQQQLTLSLVLNAPTEASTLATQLQQLRPCSSPSNNDNSDGLTLRVCQRQDSPNYEQWRQAVSDAKRSFNQGYLQKVVLARQTTFQCQHSVDFWPLFKRWQKASVNSYQIAYQTETTKGFISFTPERLFLRDGLELTTEAVAGTLPRSLDSNKARQQAQTLFSDSKTRHEHGLVAVEIGAKLEGLGVKIGQGCGTGLLKLSGLQHLHQIIQGQLPHPNMDAQLFRTLHPTAAVGGLPADSARRFILKHEPLARGLYAGCCGYFGPARSELAVTIRSAKFDFPQLTLYAGAGIVPQSDPSLEWQELEQKIALPLSLLELSYNQESSSEPQGMHAINSSRLR